MTGPRAPRLHCLSCQVDSPLGEVYRCPECGGELDIRYDLEGLRAAGVFSGCWHQPAPSLRRFGALLPIAPGTETISLGEGNTPLIRSRRLADRLGLRELWFKLEGGNPTGSFKDRQVAVGMSVAVSWGRRRFATVSSGNVGVALSAFAARAGAEALVWVSAETASAKLRQIEIYGARVFVLPSPSSEGPGAFFQAFEQLGAWCRRHDTVPMISARSVNPYMVEGAKAIAYEIAAELGGAPDLIFAPAGGGGLVGGLWKAWGELVGLGLVNHPPVLHAVQRQAYFVPIDALDDPKYRNEAYYRPLDGAWAWNAIQATSGGLTLADDEAIRSAQSALAREEGIFAEPRGAYAAAGMIRAAESGSIDRDARTICIVGGVGLKDMAAAEDMVARYGTAPTPVASFDASPVGAV